MHRLILILAATTLSLLTIGALLGLLAMSEGNGESHARWATTHRGVALAGAAGALGVFGLGAAHLRLDRRRVRQATREDRLPSWVLAQADKAARRTDLVRVGAASLLLLAAGVGLASHAAEVVRLGHAGLGAAAVAFGLGAVAVEVVSLLASGRLVPEAATRERS